MKQKYCQSCGMPMSEELYGTEKNNKKNQEYCIYCYENGDFKQPDLTMEQMIEASVPFMVQKGMKESEARGLMANCLPNLKRWRKSKITCKTVKKDQIILVGKEIRTTNEGGKCKAAIEKLWKEFSEQKLEDKIPNKLKNGEVLGLYSEYENKEFGHYSYMVGLQVKDIGNIPDGMTYKVIPASKYYVVTVKGKMPESIGEAWGYIWNADIERTYTGDFEIYDERYDGSENSEVDIYVAVK
ncbi:MULTISPECIES: effector binding domain-containing protein [Clostridium]|uniref:Transcriptional regulator n=3 Tax=Clostridium TaxID=1485 RepID=A0A3M0SSJ1_9CLOT|nr:MULTISPECIES: effector binding domain-containing protein [Clostridium]ADK14586.1 putative transcription activator [Clostridium ljungdahlii DSM 13528]AGY77827.1 effector binding domain-containing protein [Clostridium autoethanogenum DSM 10061]ALU37961.1 putative zinc ribbon domain-containing protein [Clostridium autoethanogenum DSM 10061]OAA85823.1 putative zinc ribbon domain protein [Clostridium ljungdahlii DSM 13528]OVY50725.1 putative zinc ribbon domain protein [Clostridium autoethanogenu